MAVSIVNSTAAEAWAAAESQTEQLEGLATALGSNWVARIEGTGGTLRRTQTYAALTISTTEPRSMVVGQPLTDTPVSEGDITRVVFRTSGGVDILTATAQSGSGPADIDFAGAIKTVCKPTLAGVTLTADPSLPLDVTPTPMTWQYLTVASHSRRVITSALQGNGSITTFTPTKAIAAEAIEPTTVTSVPIRAFSATIHDGNGKFFLCGGLHSNYQGNEIDEITLPSGSSTVCTVRVSHLANMPPEGADSGYAAGSGGYVWSMYGSAMADPTLWQPYPGHQWTKQLYHPDWGFCSLTPYAQTTGGVVGGIPVGDIDTDGSGYVIPSPDEAVAGFERRALGVVSFDWTTGRYTTRLTNYKPSSGDPDPAAYFGQTGVSDYSEHLGGFFGFETRSVNTAISFVPDNAARVYRGQTDQIGGYSNTSGNGILVRELELGEFLILRQDNSADGQPGYDGSFAFRAKLLHWDSTTSGAGTFTTLTVPSGPVSDIAFNVDGLTFCVDKVGRRVFWMVFPNPGVACRFYVSSFDSLMTWTLLEFTNTQTVPEGAYQDAYIATDRQPMHYWNGYLVMNSKAFINGTPPSPYPNDGWINNGCTFMRAYVGPA